jgi:hypothetical protein
MKNTNDSPDDDEQLAVPVKDYRALVDTTRPLVVAEDKAASRRLPICRDQATSLETGDCHAESVLKTGEIVSPDSPEQKVAKDGQQASTDAPPEADSDPRLRIYIGMS